MNTNEKARIESKTQQIVDALRSAGSHGLTNAKLSEISLRYGGCLGTLYKRGYSIKKAHLGNGLYRYILISEPEEITIRETALVKLMEQVEERGFVNKSMLASLLDKNGIQVKYKANTYQTS